MKRSPLNRGTSQLKRTKLNPMSKRRKASVLNNRGWRHEMRLQPCALRSWSPCSGLPDIHEILRRSAFRNSEGHPELCVPLCRRHHQIDDDDPILAERLGIRIPRWAYDLDPEGTVAWCAETRAGLQGTAKLERSSYFMHDRTPPWREQ